MPKPLENTEILSTLWVEFAGCKWNEEVKARFIQQHQKATTNVPSAKEVRQASKWWWRTRSSP
jgi:hypothetical protein